jgi:hypothetical protein
METVISAPSSPTARSRSVPLVISCEDCVMRTTAHCHDCMVSYLCEVTPGPSRGLHLSGEEVDAVALLVRAGLVPKLRFSLVR